MTDIAGFIVLKAGVNRPVAEIEQECIGLIRDKIGPVAAFKLAITVARLPKTRSGKILRGTMKKIADGDALDHAGDDRRSRDPRRDWQRAEGQGSRRVNDLRIRTMRPDEIAIAADWAAIEGWNPGVADAACFAMVDPEGFLIGELDGAPAATVSCVNYDARFAFLGFYIVRKDVRGRGYGLRIWNAAIAHAGARVIGLDGVVAQQENYKKSGFALAYANVRYGGTVAAPAAPPASVIPLSEVPFATGGRRTTPRCSRRRVRRSCAPGSVRPDMSAARSCAMAGLPPGAWSVGAGQPRIRRSSLDQHVEDLALGVDGAPQIDHPAIDFQIDFVQMPSRMGLGPAFAQVRCDHRPEMVHPAPDGLIGDHFSIRLIEE